MGLRSFGLCRDFGRGEADALIDDFHAHGAAARGDLFGAVGVAIEARLAEHICQCTAEGLRDAGDFDLDGLNVLAAIRANDERDTGRRGTRRTLRAGRCPTPRW